MIGGSGLLGQHLVGEAKARGLPVRATHSGEAIPDGIRLDLADPASAVQTVRRLRPGVVILAAAMTDVDGCETHREHAQAVNAEAPAEIAKACALLGSRLVHFSTDYVFDGSSKVPYSETVNPDPLSVYGQTKRGGERNVLAAIPSALILRTSANFGWNRLRKKTNAVTRILDELRRNEPVTLFTDQWVSPSYVREVARVAFELLDRDAQGIFHVGSRDCLSRLEIGRAVCRVFGLPEALLRPTRLSDVDLKAPRPLRSCLATAKVERFLDMRVPTFAESLAHMKEHE